MPTHKTLQSKTILCAIAPIHVIAYFTKIIIILTRRGTLELRVHWFPWTQTRVTLFKLRVS